MSARLLRRPAMTRRVSRGDQTSVDVSKVPILAISRAIRSPRRRGWASSAAPRGRAALAFVEIETSSYFVDACTGKSAGLEDPSRRLGSIESGP